MQTPINTISIERKKEFDLGKLKADVYLKMITMAICEKTMNRGTLRKDIWNYL